MNDEVQVRLYISEECSEKFEWLLWCANKSSRKGTVTASQLFSQWIEEKYQEKAGNR